MTNDEYMSQVLGPYQPQDSLGRLVVEVNKLYHAFEARDYDRRHPEITAQLPQIWEDMVGRALALRPGRAWRVLDFGCGTGFEATELIRRLPRGSLAHLTCYDASLEMLDRCRAKVAPLSPVATFHTHLDAVRAGAPYDLLATNSLLHHLPDPGGEIKKLSPLLAPDALWLAGHEPSRRFYGNPECLRTYESYLKERRWRRFLCLGNYLAKIKEWAGVGNNPARRTAKEAYRRRLFKRRPTPRVIGQLVDYHVASSGEEVACGRGLDFENMRRDFAGAWDLLWVSSYGFMGPFYAGDLPPRWARACGELGGKFPHDGANFCTLWSRI